MDIIDLRSDTVTKPSKGMKKAIYNAEVGDDVYGDDPTVNHLEKKISEMLRKDEAVFMTSGTQSNFSSVLAHCNRGDEIIVGESYHICGDEAGGVSVLGGVAMNTISVETDGSVSNNSIENAIKPDDPHHAISKLLCLEIVLKTTHNAASILLYVPFSLSTAISMLLVKETTNRSIKEKNISCLLGK